MEYEVKRRATEMESKAVDTISAADSQAKHLVDKIQQELETKNREIELLRKKLQEAMSEKDQAWKAEKKVEEDLEAQKRHEKEILLRELKNERLQRQLID
mmetsp:Transcript_13596/g.21259  ORF Transcript_13596/g.21259 Transcript_13596/m.21259 type:complete len:100 (-) Transcript_13596:1069-1368(-)